jgi:hypothetical protein
LAEVSTETFEHVVLRVASLLEIGHSSVHGHYIEGERGFEVADLLYAVVFRDVDVEVRCSCVVHKFSISYTLFI